MAGFTGIRSELYKQALREFPGARVEDVHCMHDYLLPMPGETILEVGAGSGFFVPHIAFEVGQNGRLIVADPSAEQLKEIKRLDYCNVTPLQAGAEALSEVKRNSVDSVWSFGAMHHVPDQAAAFLHFTRVLKRMGQLVIVDVLAGSKLARHFDEKVAKYSVDGHEASFLTKEFVEQQCRMMGLKLHCARDLDIHWRFNSEEDLGQFLFKLHAMVKSNPSQTARDAIEILGAVRHETGLVWLNWPLTVWSISKQY